MAPSSLTDQTDLQSKSEEYVESKFSGRYEHRVVGGGVGHNLPQEAPEAFARAIVDVGAY
jgi:pimeloyl-ACP methyl ester carboxylesterase